MVLLSQRSSDTGPAPGSLTYREIFQQPELWLTTLEVVNNAGWTPPPAETPVIITGAGTSAYAAAAIAASWANARAVPTTDLLTESVQQLEVRSPGFSKTGVLISLGRSGDSPESVAVVQQIQRSCPRVEHLAITCNAHGHLANSAGVKAIVLDPRTNDRSLAMTSSFSNLVLAGLCLHQSDQFGHSLGPISSGMEARLPHFDTEASSLASRAPDRVVILASGALQALAREASLKILEMTAGRTVTLAETFLGLRHGPMSFLTPETLVLCCLSSSVEARRYEKDLLAELRHKGLGYIVAIASAPDDTLFDTWIEAGAPNLDDALRVPFEIPFAQLFAYHLSVNAGLDPDNPSPMGAITRVVEKFRIYDRNSHG